MKSQSKLLKWSLIIGIVIVANMFINYSLSLIWTEPSYTDFCTQTDMVISQSGDVACSNAYSCRAGGL